MGNGLLAFSAATPAILFTYLMIKFNLQHSELELHPKGNQNPKLKNRLEYLFETHFERLVPVELHSKYQCLSAYVDAKSNGTYILLTHEGKKVLILKKNNFGWSVLHQSKAIDQPLQFVTPLILMLEQRFYN
ncbi:hypothetical protein [Pedobacter cryoconitis]|uniref:hypothetical protein n=1 Tax=Pedobacter cryoconitis TaxID=188932 RepID=UPI0016193A8B|nr:hypothetical protein [Pedobacter cryoconitis]MBB5645721.1 hypothetical protein [Pedobacter cryoconitis]